jgi:hypothetical protein
MELFFGIVLLLLAGGMVVLFAMVGELASRVGEPSAPKRSPEVRPLAEARVGDAPAGWPGSLSALRSADRALLVVLSTVCGICRELAPAVAAAGSAGPALIGVVVTCGVEESGIEFVAGYGLDRLPHHIDVDGRWVRDDFNVQSSPVALIVAGGKVRAALLFNDVAALLDEGTRILDDHSHEEEVMQ